MKFKIRHPESDAEWIEEFDTEEEFLKHFEVINDGLCDWEKVKE